MVHLIPSIILPHFNMKTFSGSARLFRHQPMTRKSLCLVIALGTIIFAAGCGKKDNPSATASPTPTDASQPTTPPETATAAAPSNPVYLPPLPAPGGTAITDKGETVLQQLNHAVIQYRIRNHHVPGSFEEFVASANIQAPPPPAGKKYAINNRGLIVVVDSSTP